MQTAQKHVHADKGKRGNKQPDYRPPSQNPAAPTCNQPQMQPYGVVQPHDKRPRLFRVPTPITAPRIRRPKRAEDGGDGEKQKSDGYRFIHHLFDNLRMRQPRLPALILASQSQQFGNAEHRGDTERAVADKVGGDMDFHPPRLQRGNQRLDGMRLAGNAVPQDESDHHRHKGKNKPAQLPYAEAFFIIKVHQCRNDQKQDKHFIKVGHRNVARIRTQQIAFVPTHQQAGEPRHCRNPREYRRHTEQRTGFAVAAGGNERARNVGEQGEKNKGALPHNRRLAAQKIFEQKAVGITDIAAVQAQRAVGQREAEQDKPAHRLEKPTEQHGRTRTGPQDHHFIDVHMKVDIGLHEHGGGGDNKGEYPIGRIQAADKRFAPQQFMYGQGLVSVCGHGLNLSQAVADAVNAAEILFAGRARCGWKTWQNGYGRLKTTATRVFHGYKT